MPDPFTLGFGLAFAALKHSDSSQLAVFTDLAGHLTGHFLHEDLERARDALQQYFNGRHPEKNLDLERAVMRSSVHADVYCLMEALGEPLQPSKGRVARWRRIIQERAPQQFRTQPKAGFLTIGTQEQLRAAKEVRERRLTEIEGELDFSPSSIDSRLLLSVESRHNYGQILAALAFEEVQAPPIGALPAEVRDIFQERWFPYLCGSFRHEIKHNDPVSKIFMALSLDRIERAVNKQARVTRRHSTKEHVKTREHVEKVVREALHPTTEIGLRQTDPTDYLNFLLQETAHIDIRGLRVGGGSVYQFPIDELYTPLTTVLAHERLKNKGGDKTESQSAPRAVPLQAALNSPHVVLVGDPGAGKSTFLRRIVFSACKALLENDPQAAADLIPVKPCPLPLLIRAASLAEHIRKSSGGPADADDPEWLILYLEAAATHGNWNLDAGFFRERLRAGCLLLLDGLDEVPSRTRRKSIARLLERTALAYAKARLVATSRPPAYGGETLISGFETIQIGNLDDAAIENFAGRWCRALYPSAAAASKHQSELLEEIRSKPEIREMAVNPVMLTALAALHWNQKRLPDQRSELYSSVLTWLAESREAQTGRPAVQCLQLMRRLAYAMHCHPKGKLVEITMDAAARLLAPEFRERMEEDEKREAARHFLDNEENDSGIVIIRGESLRFWHLTFEEYLAAEMLAVRDKERHKLLFDEEKLYLPEWRETVLLLAGVLAKVDSERADAFLGEMLDRLGNAPTLARTARCVGLMGRILLDLKAWNYRIADTRYQENLTRCLAIFDSPQARGIPFETRLEAAEALGRAGDPRLHEDNWVRIEGGSFWMGAQKTKKKGRNYDPEAYDDEAPVRQVEVAAFQLGRYLVTVSEYEAFVNHNGYGNEGLWTAGGFGEFKTPEDWSEQIQQPNRPVVSVSWYEAAAYCAWIGGRLPTEAEWEYAARLGREGARYPWGDDEPDPSRANYDEGGPGHPTPVGMYPAGASASGIQDMAGNVWEWVADWYDNDKDSRVLRGGSCYDDSSYLRAAIRNWTQPVYRDVNIGFRCVREVFP